jgi:SNF2 family DNA or RNA helicase
LFHLDLPWNPSRLEQRNGRIDRKLQPASRVYCRYFIYAQRPEDRVLRRLVEKTEIIRKQLGSASPVIETRIAELLAGGIERRRADLVAAEIDRIEQSDKERRARDDLEPVREADAALARRLEQLRSQLKRSQDRVGVDRMQLQRVVTYGLKLTGALRRCTRARRSVARRDLSSTPTRSRVCVTKASAACLRHCASRRIALAPSG